MNSLTKENTPSFELSITKFATKSLTIRLYEEVTDSANLPIVTYEITIRSSGKTHKGVGNDEADAFAKAITHAGYDEKRRALPEIKAHYQVKDQFHKIGTLEFNKVVRKAMS